MCASTAAALPPPFCILDANLNAPHHTAPALCSCSCDLVACGVYHLNLYSVLKQSKVMVLLFNLVGTPCVVISDILLVCRPVALYDAFARGKVGRTVAVSMSTLLSTTTT